MKRYAFLILFTWVFTLPHTAIAAKNSAQEDSCEFISLLLKQDVDDAVNKIVDMFSWNPAIAEKVGNSLAAIKNFEYNDGVSYVVADFNNIAEQHLLVMSTKKSGALYFNFVFEKLESELKIITIHFNDTYKDLTTASGPFPQAPSLIEC